MPSFGQIWPQGLGQRFGIGPLSWRVEMSRAFVWTIFFMCLTSAHAGSGETSLRHIWKSTRFTNTASIPAEWLPSAIPERVSDVVVFERFALRMDGFSIPGFIGRYGLPNRYLTATSGKTWDYLIYDLPSGHSIALYVPKPPGKTFGACVIITSDGSLVKLIK